MLLKEESHVGEASQGKGVRQAPLTFPQIPSAEVNCDLGVFYSVSPYGPVLPLQTHTHPRAGSTCTVVRILFTGVQRARLSGSAAGAKHATRKTIKFFRQTRRRRGRSSFPGRQKEQRDICREDALGGFTLRGGPAGTVVATGRAAVGQCQGQKWPQSPAGRLSEPRGRRSQSRRGCVLSRPCPRLPFLLPEPRMEGRAEVEGEEPPE